MNTAYSDTVTYILSSLRVCDCLMRLSLFLRLYGKTAVCQS